MIITIITAIINVINKTRKIIIIIMIISVALKKDIIISRIAIYKNLKTLRLILNVFSFILF